MNQVKSAHPTIDNFGSVKYAELVGPMEENGNSPVPIAAVSYQKIHFFFNCDNLHKLLQ